MPSRAVPRPADTVAVPPAHPGFAQPPPDLSYLYASTQPVSPSSTLRSAADSLPAAFAAPARKRNSSSAASQAPLKKQNKQASASGARKNSQQSSRTMSDVDSAQTAPPVEPPAASKPKRVRTGCLTCRERHLKCDEALPHCQNCRKSNRICKRGIRLNFIDTTVQAPPVVPPSQDWNISFLDESRDIASEYKGGLSKYGAPEVQATTNAMNGLQLDFSQGPPPAPELSHQPLPPIQGVLPDIYAEGHNNMMYETTQPPANPHVQHAGLDFSASSSIQAASAYNSHEPTTSPPARSRDYLNTQEEVLFMQVFVEEVGLWMDSMDPQKHFSRLLPFHALGEPMLLNAFLACGARHLSLVNARYTEDKALNYYDTATRYLLNSLQNPNRDTVICATTAVILNVYEIMCERALQRMNHIAGARALIKECGWNARSTGIGAACFWLNVGMELLSCLHFNWQVAWDPDEWGVDMDFTRETEAGREEVWTYRIVYIVAKIANFRASIPRKSTGSPQDDHIRLQKRYAEWQRLRDWCDSWNECIPRTMHPMAYLYPYQTTSQSAFPEVWLIKRTTIVARLFYHTAMCLMAQVNPIESKDGSEMHDLLQRHSQQICGIVAHVKDR
ncbi:putative c6 zinc finger domain-containing protein [Diplodia seriata]|uniref:Putative c6 zinc finger domain-containing protein n=1 Tax=Diplodia seriata TaxID=420778 RepID=A0A0G2FVN9_9PEZI|nr:putative c6 zinc finger domain-containing protein [Diplodia seriata]